MNLIKYTSIIFALLISARASAAWIVEPYGGYAIGKTDAHAKASASFPTGVDAGDTSTEISVGARLGLETQGGLWIALDPQFGLSGMAKANTGGTSSAYKRTQGFVDLGIDASILRAYVGYGVLNNLDFGDSKAAGGLALKAGLGLAFASNVSLNIEYHMTTFQDVTANGVTNSVSATYDNFQQSLVVVGLSFPFGGMMNRR